MFLRPRTKYSFNFLGSPLWLGLLKRHQVARMREELCRIDPTVSNPPIDYLFTPVSSPLLSIEVGRRESSSEEEAIEDVVDQPQREDQQQQHKRICRCILVANVQILTVPWLRERKNANLNIRW